MYKCKLQEYCQRNSWSLPKYTVTKDGQDHNPKFKATVVVSGVNYEIQGFHKSSKDAQNEAARVAFESLFDAERSSSDEDASAAEPGDPFHSGPTQQNDDLLKNSHAEARTQEDASHLEENNEAMASEVQLNYKSYLQELVQRRRWSTPVYSQVREGPPHSPCFQATVTVEGKSFKSRGFFGTVREAEHDVAKVALASFHEEGIEEEKYLSFKNMLRDYSQKCNLHLPTYTTNISGASHLPTFKSTVEIDGEVYTGDPARTKKEAEANAAKFAWFTLKECGSRTSSSKLQLGTVSNVPAVNLASSERNHKLEASSSDNTEAKGSLILENRESNPSLEYRPQVAAGSGASTMNPVSNKQQHMTSLTSNDKAEESTVLTSGKNLSNVHAIAGLQEPAVSDVVDKNESHLVPEEESAISSEFSANIYAYLNEQFIAGNSTAQSIEPASSASERLLLAPTGSPSKSASNQSRPDGSTVLDGISTAPKLQNKVVVFPRLRNLKLPEGRVQVQFCDVKWVAVTGTDSGHGAK